MFSQPKDSVTGPGSKTEKELQISSDMSESLKGAEMNVKTSTKESFSSLKTDQPENSSDFSESIKESFTADLVNSSDFSASVKEPLSSLNADFECASDMSESIKRSTFNENPLISNLDMVSSVSALIWCDVCALDKKQVKAHKLCIDCQQLLCTGCCDFHRKIKVLQSHVLQDKKLGVMANQHNQIKSTTDLKDEDTTSNVKEDIKHACTMKCSLHADRILEYFCKTCDEIGCIICITTQHNKCSRLHHIPDIVKPELKDNEEYKRVNETLEEMGRHLEQNKIKYETNVQKKAYYRNRAKSEIERHRNEMNAMLDAFDMQINSDLDSMDLYNSELLKKIREREESLNKEIKSVLSGISLKENSERMCDIFIATKKAKSKLETLQDEITQLDVNNHVVSYKFEASEDINELKQKIQQSGKLQPVYSSPKTIESSEEVDIKEDSDKVAGTISGLCFLTEHMILLTDVRNEVVKIMETQKKSILTTFAMPSKPWDVSKIRDDQVVVTLPEDKNIMFLSIKQSGSIETEKQISVDGLCRGIAHSHGQIFVSFDKPESMVQILDKTGHVMKSFKIDQFGNKLFRKPWYLTLSLDGFTIYVSDNAGNSVTSMTLEGQVMATYKDKDLRKSVGITVDDDGSVYILGSSMYSSHIYQLSENLNLIHVHSNIGEGIINPRSAAFDNKAHKLYVGMEFSDKIKVISMSTIKP